MWSNCRFLEEMFCGVNNLLEISVSSVFFIHPAVKADASEKCVESSFKMYYSWWPCCQCKHPTQDIFKIKYDILFLHKKKTQFKFLLDLWRSCKHSRVSIHPAPIAPIVNLLQYMIYLAHIMKKYWCKIINRISYSIHIFLNFSYCGFSFRIVSKTLLLVFMSP